MSKKKYKLQQEIMNEIADDVQYETFNKNNSKLFRHITINKKFKNKKQKNLFRLILKNRIIFINGPAGCGKSFVSLIAALDMLKYDKYKVEKITLTKPIIEAAKSIGYLKGTLEDKTTQYFASFYENMKKIIGKVGIKLLNDNNKIKHIILNFIRGNTFGEYDENNKPIGYVCILDEAQNINVHELKTFISRMGEHTRLIILGDSEQSDIKLKKNELSGLEWAFKNLQDIDNVAFFSFDENDIVREPLLIDIMKRFK